jgi:hypothetical protein
VQYSEALHEALRGEMLRDERVFVMGEGVGGLLNGVFNVTQELQKQFGEWRAMGNPLSEAAIAGTGVGAAVFGRHPVPEIMFNNLLALVALSARTRPGATAWPDQESVRKLAQNPRFAETGSVFGGVVRPRGRGLELFRIGTELKDT